MLDLVGEIKEIKNKGINWTFDPSTDSLEAIREYLEALVAADITAIEAKLDHASHGLAALKALIDAAEVKLDKLAGEPTVNSTESKLWNTAEQDLVSLGTAATKKKLHSLIVDISGLTAAAVINIRLYLKVNGVEKKVYDQTFTVGTDPDGCWVVNGTLGLHDVLRVTCRSDTVADDGKAIGYTYMLEAM